MDQYRLRALLADIQSGRLSIDKGLEMLKGFPAEQLDGAFLDHQRHLRTGVPEVIYGESKTAAQIITLGSALMEKGGVVLATRVAPDKAETVLEQLPQFTYHEQARMLQYEQNRIDADRLRGTIIVICAGTSDLPVAEEARITAEAFGHHVNTIYDAGVAGLHRLLAHRNLFAGASVIIVVAGMEGALPSVVGGLVDCPVIGVPASIGYGAGIGGFAALLGMLNSCAPGLAVVNIDNGFGAACMAAKINTLK